MELLASAEAYRRVAAWFDEPISMAENAVTIIDNGMETTGTSWHPKGMSAEFGQKFPPTMETLSLALIQAAEGLASLKKNFLVMAQNIENTETINRS